MAANAPSIVIVNPNDIALEANVRRTVKLDKGFVASIREHGVLQPPLATRSSDGTITVRGGQRRVLAAREAGLSEMPIYVTTATDEQGIRLIQQLIENDQRRALTETDRVEAYRQLAFDGLSVEKIARSTGAKKKSIESSLTVAASPAGLAAIATGQVTLEHAAALAEFEDELEVVEELTRVAIESPGRLAHALQYQQNERNHRRLIAATVAELEAKGIRTTTDDSVGERLSSLTASEESNTALDETEHASCPGHALRVYAWHSDENARTSPVCLDAAGNGHHSRYGYASQPTRQTGPMSESEKAERARVIENNKRWDASEPIRRAFLTDLIARKTLPTNMLGFVASVMAGDSGLIDHKATNLARTLLGLPDSAGYNDSTLTDHGDAHPSRAGHVVSAIALAAIEANTGRHTWRTPSKTSRRYLTELETWGYTLSDVEKVATGYTL